MSNLKECRGIGSFGEVLIGIYNRCVIMFGLYMFNSDIL